MGLLEWLLPSETKYDLERRLQQDSADLIRLQKQALAEMLLAQAELFKAEAQDLRVKAEKLRVLVKESEARTSVPWLGNVPIGELR